VRRPWLPAGVRQRSRELLARTVHIRPGRDLRNPEHVADFLEREVFLVSQHHGGAVLRAKRRQRQVQSAAERFALDGIWSRILDRRLAELRRRIQRNVRRARAAQRVDGGVVRDPEQPARQPARRVERLELLECLDERVLREVFRERAIAPVTDDPGNQTDDRPLIAADDPFERGLRARQRLDDQAGLGDRLEIDRDCPGPL